MQSKVRLFFSHEDINHNILLYLTERVDGTITLSNRNILPVPWSDVTLKDVGKMIRTKLQQTH